MIRRCFCLKTYDRQKAVEYANKWWDDYNPEYAKFDEDCTNFISQCLLAGGAPMDERGKIQWWYHKNGKRKATWSRSWANAHRFRRFLMRNKKGITTTEVKSPNELDVGDIICYDFDGDDKWQHNAIVTAKDFMGTPYVNAHEEFSFQRYWTYQDSSFWSPNIRYTFLKINDEFK